MTFIQNKFLKFLIILSFLFWCLFLLYPIVRIIRIEAYNYQNINYDAKLLFGFLSYLTLFAGVLVSVFLSLFILLKGKNSFIVQFVSKYIFFSAIILLVIFRFALVVESIKYANYLYSNIGISVANIQSITMICLTNILIIIFLIRIGKDKHTVFNSIARAINNLLGQSNNYININNANLNIIALVLLLYITYIVSTFISLPTIYKNYSTTYDKKFGYQYQYVEFLKNTTPDNSIIIHPPRDTVWPTIGNQEVLRYFLYPRTLVDGYIFNGTEKLSDFNSPYFIKLTEETDGKEWPIIKPDNKIIIFDQKTPVHYKKLIKINSINDQSLYQINF